MCEACERGRREDEALETYDAVVTAQAELGIEWPETYVDALSRTLYEANGNSNVNGGTVASYDDLHPSVKAHLRRGVAAVAGQLLSDLANAMTDDVFDDICIWAGENGLDVMTSPFTLVH